jgi:hypothetical protein
VSVCVCMGMGMRVRLRLYLCMWYIRECTCVRAYKGECVHAISVGAYESTCAWICECVCVCVCACDIYMSVDVCVHI